MAAPRRRLSSALGVSMALHAGLFTLILIWAGLQPHEVATRAIPIRTDLVFLQQAGPGGGGGGSPAPAPPKRLEIPAHRAPAVLVEAVPVPVERPIPTLDAPVQTAAANLLQASGANPLGTVGPGGGGRGTGVGPGDGPGVGPGSKGGTGGGPRGPGADLTPPVPIREVKPAYTAGALARKIQGSVTLEVEVLANGTVGHVKVLKSLDPGLDLEAIRAARRWVFRPATRAGKPVDVIAQMILDFNLR